MWVNAWLGIPAADHNELNNRRGTENNVGPAKQFVDGQLDPDVVQPMYKVRTVGPNSWYLWSVVLNDEDGPINQQINAFRAEFASAQVLGAWLPSGEQLRDEVGDVMYQISDTLSQYMPDNPDDTPNPTVRDVNHVAGWAPRIFA